MVIFTQQNPISTTRVITVKVTTGIPADTAITHTTMVHMVVPITGMGTTGMHGDPITTVMVTGCIIRSMTIKNQIHMHQVMKHQETHTTTPCIIMGLLVGMTGTPIFIMDTQAIHTRMHLLCLLLMLTTITTPTTTVTQMLLHTIQVGLADTMMV
jgi:hypothetical protein